MPARLKLEGERFTRLMVIKYLGKSLWLCECDCGNFTQVKTKAIHKPIHANNEYQWRNRQIRIAPTIKTNARNDFNTISPSILRLRYKIRPWQLACISYAQVNFSSYLPKFAPHFLQNADPSAFGVPHFEQYV